MYIEEVKKDAVAGIKKKVKYNLSRAEYLAINQLEDNTIVIRPCEKGSGVVVMNTEDYTNAVENELLNCLSYKEIPHDITSEIEGKIRRIINKLYSQGVISNGLKGYLLPLDSRAGKAQGNPKMHKENNPLRIIVNGRNHPTTKLAEVAERELTKHVEELPTYIKDTTDFLHKVRNIPQPIPQGSIFFCMDVKSLYPSVPREEAREACQEALEQRSNTTISTETVLKLIDTVLENNNFQFNGNNYVQVEGTSIGSKLGKNYACTYLGKWEQTLLEKYPDKPYAFWRFIDDIWGIWDKGLESLKQFHATANSIHPKIQVDLRYSDTDIEFLDVRTYLRDGHILTDLFCKQTDKHQYLHNSSDHPLSTKNAIPYGIGVRVKRICSDNDNYLKHRNEMKTHLLRRGHQEPNIEQQLQKVDMANREDLLMYKARKDPCETKVPLVTTFNKHIPNIRNILTRHLPTLHRSESMKDIFPEAPVVFFKRGQNITDVLVHTKHNKIFHSTTNMSGPCNKRCAVCKVMKQTTSFEDREGNTYTVGGEINCKTVNVVYGIYCEICKKVVYVGETGTTLYERIQNHLSTIRCERNDVVPIHFNGPRHTISDFAVIGIQKINRSWTYRKEREVFWIRKLGTLDGDGLNRKGR